MSNSLQDVVNAFDPHWLCCMVALKVKCIPSIQENHQVRLH